MFRRPFVWEVRVRREVLEDEIARLRDLPYSIWQEMLGRSLVKSATGRDGRSYRVRTQAAWSQPGSEDIRIVVSLETPGLRRRVMRQSFVITPENRFAE